jgi:hypothetical protein
VITALLASRLPGTPVPHPGGATFVARGCLIDAVDDAAALARA